MHEMTFEIYKCTNDTGTELQITASINSEPVGEMTIIVYDDNTAYLERIDVDEGKRGRGYGTQMLKHAAGYADTVYIAPDNADAQRLYNRVGSQMRSDYYDAYGFAIDQGYGVYTR